MNDFFKDKIAVVTSAGSTELTLNAACWLLDGEASGFVTGITIPVDGGFQAASGV